MATRPPTKVMPLVRIGHICPYCWKKTKRRDSMFVKFMSGEDLGFVYVCEECKAYVQETEHGSLKGDGRLMNDRDRTMYNMVCAHWRTLLNYRVYKPYHLKRIFGDKLAVEPENFELNTLSFNQLYRLRKMILDMIKGFKEEGRVEYGFGMRNAKNDNPEE